MDDIHARLFEVLSCSVYETTQVLRLVVDRLEAAGRTWEMLPGNCLYSKGTREDAVVMVAHIDTVWKSRYNGSDRTPLNVANGRVSSARSITGIGADDRAGVAIILELLDLGHSILLTDDEEIGMVGSRHLRAFAPEAFEALQKHSFFVQFDRMGRVDFKCYNVGTDAFRDYVHKATGLTEPNRSSFTDIATLCRDVAGVNISVGYQNEHTPEEYLALADWDFALHTARAWLSQPTPRFELPEPPVLPFPLPRPGL